MTNFVQYNYANQLLYNPILSLVKLSVILFMLRLNGQKRSIRIFAWAIFAVTLILMVAIIIVVIFQCSPIPFVYDTTIKGGHCIQQGAFYVATASITILTDILVLILPTWITIGLQMPVRQKAAVIGLLSLGLVVTAVGIYRMVILVQAFFPTTPSLDPTYSIGFCTSAVETNLAIMTACGPALKPLVKRYLPKLLGSSGYGPSSRSAPMYYHHRGTGYGNGTQVSTVHAGSKAMAFEMGGMRKSRKMTTSGSDDDSEKGIMAYNDGINKTVDVTVNYLPHDQAGTPGSSSDTSYVIQEPPEGRRTPGAEAPRTNARKMSAERMV